VGGVRPDSPAEYAGLAAGDVITAVAGRPGRAAADLERALKADGSGGRLAIEYIRAGATHQAETEI
jgi:S1-C subfamily serine protease